MVMTGQACWTVGLWATCASLILVVACKTFGISSEFAQILQLIDRNFKLLIVTNSVKIIIKLLNEIFYYFIFLSDHHLLVLFLNIIQFFCQIHVISGSMQLCITVSTNVTHDTKHKIRIIMITCNILY